MNIKESLITELKTKISELDKEINKEELNKILEIKSKAKTLLDKVEVIRQLKKEGKQIDKSLGIKKEDITTLNISTILEIFPDFNKDLLDTLQLYSNKLWGFFFDQHKETVLNNLSLTCTNLLDKITEKENIVNSINEEKDKLQQLVNSLETNYENIFDNDINQIIDFLKQIGKTEVEILQYIKELILDIEKYINETKIETTTNQEEFIEEEIFEENEEDIETIKQGIIRILNENGYNDIVSYFEEEKDTKKIKEAKEKLYTFGKLNNIEQIVKTLKKYNINLLEQMKSNFYKIIMILLYSSKENIESIFQMALDPNICICKYDELGNIILDEQGKKQINFTLLLEHVSRFLNRKKMYHKRGNEYIEINIASENIGAMEDFIKNIRFFQKLGVDVKALFKKFEQLNKKSEEKQRQSIGSYFDIPHEMVLRNKEIFDLYRIPRSSYLSALSCFVELEPADTIDMFIELDLLDYLKNNMSRMTLKPDSPIFYRIVRTYQQAENLPNPQKLPLHQNAKKFLFKEQQGKPIFDGYISNPEAVIKRGTTIKLDTGIDKQNGSIITKKYTREEVLTEEQLYNFSYFDEVIKNKGTNNDTIDLIDEKSILIRKINHMSNFGQGPTNILIFGREPNEFRISKLKFFRIYNTLIKSGYNLENDKDCVLYALTYNSILTIEQFELVKTIVDNIFKYIPQKGGRVGGRK